MHMSAAITCSALHWSTPDGDAVLSGVSLTFNRERAGLVGRNGVGKTTLLRLITGDLIPSRGAINVSGTTATVKQLVQIAPDATIADLFGVTDQLALLHRAEAGDADADALANADWTLETRIAAALARTGLDAEPNTKLTRLSGGQRTRAALAGAILADPDFLLLDEPTNNLDRDGRTAVLDLLADWRAGAIIVSHDRALLEAMDATVELSSLGARRYGGNWSHYQERKAIEQAAAEQDLATAEQQVKDTARKTQIAVERQQRRDATGACKGAKGGMPRILIGARKQRAERTGGDNALLAQRLRATADASAAAARARIERVEDMHIHLPPTHLAPDRTVLRLDTVTAGYDPDAPVLDGFSLHVEGPERIAITGPNGSGKTTLLSLIDGTLEPWAGTVSRSVAHAMLDQTAAILDPALSIADNFARLNPTMDHNGCRAALAAFRFRGDSALRRVGALSGGQMLRAGLACVLGGATPPPLLILDEPTNHLDLDSIAAVEAGLRAYDGALLVVSHDETFLEAIGITRHVELGIPLTDEKSS